MARVSSDRVNRHEKGPTMIRRLTIPMLVIALLLGVSTAFAADAETKPADSGSEAHKELRVLRDGLIAAINKQDMDAVLAHLDDEVIYTPQNAEVCRGKAAVKAYFDKMMNGPQKIVKSFSVKIDVDELAKLYGDTAVSHGQSHERFVLTDGKDLQMHSKWTASLARKNGEWKVTSFHVSNNVFDNAVLDLYKQVIFKAGVGGVLVGVLLMGVVWWGVRRKPKAGA